MSKQVAIATAALAAVAISSADAQWTANGGLSGTGGGRPNYNAGLSYGGSTGWSAGAGVGGQFGSRPSTITGGVQYTSPNPTGWNMNAGIQHGAGGTSGGITLNRKFEDDEEEYDEQIVKLPHDFWKPGPFKPILYEDELDEVVEARPVRKSHRKFHAQHHPQVIHTPNGPRRYANHTKPISIEKDGVRHTVDWSKIPKWTFHHGNHTRPHKPFHHGNHTRPYPVHRPFHHGNHTKPVFPTFRALEEEEWEFDAGVGGNGREINWKVGISHKWDEEEDNDEQGLSLKKVKKALNKVGKAAGKVSNAYEKAQQIGVLEEEEGWEVGGGIGGNGGDINWNVNIKGSWEEEDEYDEQKFKLKKTLDKIGKAAGKISNAYEKAQQIGVLEEEEWEMNAGISGNGGKPSWNVGIGHKWEDEAPVSRRFGRRFPKA